MQLAYELVASGKVRTGSLITHRFGPEDIAKAYEMIDKRSEQFLQIVLDWR